MGGFRAKGQISFPEDNFYLLPCCIADSSSSNRKTNISNSLLQLLVPSNLEGEKVGKVLYPLSPMFHRSVSLVMHNCTACDTYSYSCPGMHLITRSHSCSHQCYFLFFFFVGVVERVLNSIQGLQRVKTSWQTQTCFVDMLFFHCRDQHQQCDAVKAVRLHTSNPAWSGYWVRVGSTVVPCSFS